MPLISVIVPVYKVEHYLRRCVDSILAQTFEDFELILVDDGSPDNCGAICDEYAEKDGRIHVIHQQNGGLSAARNAGIDWAFRNSGSDWLSFIDSDDWVHPCFLEYLFRGVMENNVLISACGFKRVEEYEPFEMLKYSSQIMAWDEFYINDPVNGTIAVNKLYWKQVFYGMRYPVGKLHEDEFLTYKLLYKAERVACLLLPMYYYYQNSESIMKRPFSLKRLDGADAVQEQCAFAKQIDNSAFYDNREAAFIRCLATDIAILKDTDSIETAGKKTAIKKLRKKLKKELNKNGRNLIPFEENLWVYENAFPARMWLYWTARGIIGKAKRLVKNNAQN